ncbi:hypothetical protein CEUSTIGMA_g7727.t1 [Chlamydomonas eustigma]|uniref:Uncharacterized protein n=1 Tax=Chlamydomonas eustigma TaxID=1157962 RepID=A0A250XBL6_9CHLO|nr:hypothetical protein CEUSTIGMA_g7727.t1 [Chlamydomonas eustigma]|eukprot:GAX80289.1 hypothetical protein CEUSTIGMA_g7727.t1 [Chlamydomonas eustigma]
MLSIKNLGLKEASAKPASFTNKALSQNTRKTERCANPVQPDTSVFQPCMIHDISSTCHGSSESDQPVITAGIQCIHPWKSVAMACATCPRRKKGVPKPRPRSSSSVLATDLTVDVALPPCPYL